MLLIVNSFPHWKIGATNTWKKIAYLTKVGRCKLFSHLRFSQNKFLFKCDHFTINFSLSHIWYKINEIIQIKDAFHLDWNMSLCCIKSLMGRKQSCLWKEKTCVSGQTAYLIKEREEGLQSKTNSPAPHSKLLKQDLCHSKLHSQQLASFFFSWCYYWFLVAVIWPNPLQMQWLKSKSNIPTTRARQNQEEWCELPC